MEIYDGNTMSDFLNCFFFFLIYSLKKINKKSTRVLLSLWRNLRNVTETSESEFPVLGHVYGQITELYNILVSKCCWKYITFQAIVQQPFDKQSQNFNSAVSEMKRCPTNGFLERTWSCAAIAAGVRGRLPLSPLYSRKLECWLPGWWLICPCLVVTQ